MIKNRDLVRWTPDARDSSRYAVGTAELVLGGRVARLCVQEMHGRWPEFQQYGKGCFVDPGYAYGEIVPLPSPDRTAANCRSGGPCCIPKSGGACEMCNFPRARAHPDCISSALDSDAVYVNGTALVIEPAPELWRGIVAIIQRDGTEFIHPIPGWAEGLPARECWLRWNENHANIERGLTICHILTDPQIRLAKDFHRAEVIPVQSYLLRRRVEAAMAAGHGREITVVLPDYELETANTAEPTIDEIRAFNQRS